MFRTRSRSRPRRSALSLIEVVASLAVSGIILTAVGAAMHVVTRNGANVLAAADQETAVSIALSRFEDEVALALKVTVLADHEITFQHPDVTGDGNADEITYAWSATVGDPLTRAVNGAAPVTMLPEVHRFSLGFESGTRKEKTEGEEKESDELVLFEYENYSGLHSVWIHENDWYGQAFVPEIPDEATSWRITRVFFVGRRESWITEPTRIELYVFDGGATPSLDPVAETWVPAEALPTHIPFWIEASFSDAGGLGPGSRVALVWGAEASTTCELLYSSAGGAPPGSMFATVQNGGTTWTMRSTDTMLISVSGTYTVSGSPVETDVQSLTAVRVDVEAGAEPRTRRSTGVRTLNTPQCTGC